jgi:hypothetical protein
MTRPKHAGPFSPEVREPFFRTSFGLLAPDCQITVPTYFCASSDFDSEESSSDPADPTAPSLSRLGVCTVGSCTRVRNCIALPLVGSPSSRHLSSSSTLFFSSKIAHPTHLHPARQPHQMILRRIAVCASACCPRDRAVARITGPWCR